MRIYRTEPHVHRYGHWSTVSRTEAALGGGAAFLNTFHRWPFWRGKNRTRRQIGPADGGGVIASHLHERCVVISGRFNDDASHAYHASSAWTWTADP